MIVIEKCNSAREGWEVYSSEYLSLIEKGDSDSLNLAKELSMGEGSVLFEDMRTQMDVLTNILLENAENSKVNSASLYSNITFQTISLTLAALLIGVLATVFITRSILNPLNKIKGEAKDLASTGDLSRRTEVYG